MGGDIEIGGYASSSAQIGNYAIERVICGVGSYKNSFGYYSRWRIAQQYRGWIQLQKCAEKGFRNIEEKWMVGQNW